MASTFKVKTHRVIGTTATTVNLSGSGYAMAQLDAVIDGGTF